MRRCGCEGGHKLRRLPSQRRACVPAQKLPAILETMAECTGDSTDETGAADEEPGWGWLVPPTAPAVSDVRVFQSAPTTALGIHCLPPVLVANSGRPMRSEVVLPIIHGARPEGGLGEPAAARRLVRSPRAAGV